MKIAAAEATRQSVDVEGIKLDIDNDLTGSQSPKGPALHRCDTPVHLNVATIKAVMKFQSAVRGRRARQAYVVSRDRSATSLERTAAGRLFSDFTVFWSAGLQCGLLGLIIWGFATSTSMDKSMLTRDMLDFCNSNEVADKCFLGLATDAIPEFAVPEAWQEQQQVERRGESEPFKSPLHGHPNFMGFAWNYGVILHLVFGFALCLLSPVAARDTWVRTKLMHSMAHSREKLQTCFGFGVPLAVLHHYLIMAQVSLGLTLAAPRFLDRGFTMYKWYAVSPGFRLPLYLQFVALGSLSITAAAELVFLRVHGLEVPKGRMWEKHLIFVVTVVTVLICILALICYFYFCFPYDMSVSYAIVFCLQVPICIGFAYRQYLYWYKFPRPDRLLQWQAAMNRASWLLVFLSSTTFLANVCMDIHFTAGTAGVYAVGNLMLLYWSFWMDRAVYRAGDPTNLGLLWMCARRARSAGQKMRKMGKPTIEKE